MFAIASKVIFCCRYDNYSCFIILYETAELVVKNLNSQNSLFPNLKIIFTYSYYFDV